MDETEQTHRQFIEDAGDMLEEHGLPHMAGRVIGSLLVCVPPYRALDELAEELAASKGAVSMATQLLLRLGVIERMSLPGERRHYYRVRHDVWSSLFTQGKEHWERHHRIAQAGLELLDGQPAETKMRLLELLVFLDFVAEEAPEFIERWKARRADLMEKRLQEYG